MAKLNDTLVTGNLTCSNTIAAPYYTSDGSVKFAAQYNNEANFYGSSNSTLYINYRGGFTGINLCNGSGQ